METYVTYENSEIGLEFCARQRDGIYNKLTIYILSLLDVSKNNYILSIASSIA